MSAEYNLLDAHRVEKSFAFAAALAHLHYFIGGCDWWIVEKDSDPDHAGQVQAFGIADLGMGAELGYISIPELLENGAETDLYFKAKTIGDILG